MSNLRRLIVIFQRTTAPAAGAAAAGANNQYDLSAAKNTCSINIMFPPSRLSAGVCTWMGPKDVQEDRFLFDKEFKGPQNEPILLYAVFDGHSGHLCADWCVQNFPRFFQNQLHKDRSKKLTEEFLKQTVRTAFLQADEEFCDLARQSMWMDGTTGVIAFVWESRPNSEVEQSRMSTPSAAEDSDPVSGMRLLVANVGDSRGVMVQKKVGSDRRRADCSCMRFVVS